LSQARTSNYYNRLRTSNSRCDRLSAENENDNHDDDDETERTSADPDEIAENWREKLMHKELLQEKMFATYRRSAGRCTLASSAITAHG